MSERNEVIQLALDTYRGNVQNYSKEQGKEVLRNALIDLNGGDTKIDYKTMRRNKPEFFEIIEEMLDVLVVEGLENDQFFNRFVERKSAELGDRNDFYVEDDSLFVVSEIASGTQNLRRQRLNAGKSFTVPTSWKGVKVYEEFERFMSGRIDFDVFINRIAQSYSRKIANEVYDGFVDTFGSLPSEFTKTGSFSESDLVELIEHVEAANQSPAIIAGTKLALRKIDMDTVSETAKEQVNQMGYFGTFNGTEVMSIRQLHKPGSFDWAITNDDLYVIPSNTQPIKMFDEGQSLIIDRDYEMNQDLTREYMVNRKYGVGILVARLFGIYRM